MEKEEYEEWMTALQQSSGHKKFVNYIHALIDTKEFSDFVLKIREKYDIPRDGYKDKEQIVHPTNWVHRHTDKNREFSKEVSVFAQKHHLHHLDGEDLFSFYSFHNEVIFFASPNSYNLCSIMDIPMEKDEPFSEETTKDDDRLFPIAVRISPYASLRDILDFVKRTYKYEIKFLQNQYKEKGVKVGKFKQRKSNLRERNEFIYKHKHLPRKQIMSLLSDKFGAENTIDYAYIGKIISLENKRRKEV